MKYILTILLILTFGETFAQNGNIVVSGFDTTTGMPGYKYTLKPTRVTAPLTLPNDSTIAISLSATSPIAYSGSTGVFSLGTVPIANGGTNNASLSVTAGTIYYGDGTKLIGLAPGTAAQHLTGGTTPSWKDTAVSSGGSGWSLTGNSLLNWSKYMGSTDTSRVSIATAGVTRIMLDSNRIGFGGPARGDYYNSLYRSAQILGNPLVADNASLSMNPSISGSEFTIETRAASSGSGSTILPTGYLLIYPKNGTTPAGTSRVGVFNNGSLAVGAMNDNTYLLNVNTVSGTSGTFGLNQNGINRWLFQNTATNGDLRIINGSTALNINNTTLNVTVGSTTDVASALLNVPSTTKGFAPPRMTKTQRDAITSPAASLLIYQTDNTPGLRVFNGTNWMRFSETID